ncbi:hypothetical protein [Arthrobacter cryoconiti]|uniref:Uncharacterized protein n=1 Tax=Arthrobacter cryoconiti TaxID=748907 RepID=A0ABV8R2F7_9MICC|nr:hypothetical protein [Arthrobacter cryoconiti]MCC9069305.1 hypothetical protein [Arthrobacter cryoconiti]
MSIAFWVCAVVTVISSLVSGGYALAGFRSATVESRVPSMYALARSLALVLVAIVGLLSSSIPFVASAALAMIVVQGLDAVIGAHISDRLKTIGPAVVSVVNAAVLIWMLTT